MHEGESFGICLMDESEPTEDTSGVAPGLRYEHEGPTAPASEVSRSAFDARLGPYLRAPRHLC